MSCHPVRKAVRTFDRKPFEAARYCASKYPTKTDTTTIEVTIPGETEVRYLTDTVKAPCPDGTAVRVPCPPARHTTRVDTYYKYRTIWRENTAEKAYLMGKLDSLGASHIRVAQKAESNAVNARRAGYIGAAGWLLFILTLVIIHFANKRKFI